MGKKGKILVDPLNKQETKENERKFIGKLIQMTRQITKWQFNPTNVPSLTDKKYKHMYQSPFHVIKQFFLISRLPVTN